MDPIPRSELVGTAGLVAAAVAALLLSGQRGPKAAAVEQRHRATVTFVAAVVLQGVHVVEEYSTHFYERYPAILGLAPWPSSFFLAFNAIVLGIWVSAAFGLRTGCRPAFFAAWFLALAAMGNGVAHPLLSLRAGGYAPGLVTSPLVGIAGICLWIRLRAITEPRANSWIRGSRYRGGA